MERHGRAAIQYSRKTTGKIFSIRAKGERHGKRRKTRERQKAKDIQYSRIQYCGGKDTGKTRESHSVFAQKAMAAFCPRLILFLFGGLVDRC